jgi:hydrogenase maturation protein HypF
MGMTKSKAEKLIFKGVVQGVGFRPTVYRVATELGIHGYVLNKGSEVEVVVDRDADQFIAEVRRQLPAIASIHDIHREPESRSFSEFKILHSRTGEKDSLIPVDTAICQDCLHDLFEEGNRRYRYPFTNCTVCGARYSITKGVPYDRERTSMDAFPLCAECEREYTDVMNRRYHAQTISCPRCGPQYILYDSTKKSLGSMDAVERFARMLDAGRIGVVKSWGGMHLCCSLQELHRFRKWYGRPQKPFAIMVRDVATAERYAEMTQDDRQLLESSARPIVVMKKRDEELVAPGLDSIGVFLPYTGLQVLLFSELQQDALVMTSANFPGEPMIIDNDKAFSLGADMYLLHNRQIPVRVDDSVIRLWTGRRFFLRKSRGFVPNTIPVPYKDKILSVGAGENSTGSLSVDGRMLTTQYIGNVEYYEAAEFLEQSLQHLMDLFVRKPGLDGVALDLHPGYASRAVAQRFSETYHAPTLEVQHHFAHAASLLVDAGVERSIVLALDGLGYGEDGSFWGSEVLDSELSGYARVGHLRPFPLIGGDQATKDPRRLVYAIFKELGIEKEFSGKNAEMLQKVAGRSPVTCSMGRYLDALSCYLGVCRTRTYSGEPAMKLEPYLATGRPRYKFTAPVSGDSIDAVEVFRQLDELVDAKTLSESKKADLAYSAVHAMVQELVGLGIERAREERVQTIGLTGGVSYDLPIVSMIEHMVTEAGLSLLVHNRVPNGDGGISVGQNAVTGTLL